MKPVIVQSVMKRRRHNRPTPELDDKLYVDTATPTAKFVFWGLAAVVVLSLLIA